MPLAPVPTHVAHLAVPTARILNNLVPAKRVPVRFPTLLTHKITQQLPEWYLLVTARQLVLLLEIRVRECLVVRDILESANREVLNINPVEWILAIDTLTTLITRFVVLEARTTPICTTFFALTVYCLFQLYTS